MILHSIKQKAMLILAAIMNRLQQSGQVLQVWATTNEMMLFVDALVKCNTYINGKICPRVLIKEGSCTVYICKIDYYSATG